MPAHAGKTDSMSTRGPENTAHPRSRGENHGVESHTIAHGGSSPLTRGKRGFAGGADEPAGLIPAHAGKTVGPAHAAWAHKAHPRSRGENLGDHQARGVGHGSSPLTRGKRNPPCEQHSLIGLIPAHAGKTCCMARLMFSAPAHPRSRGENWSDTTQTVSIAGSSPPTRGKHLSAMFDRSAGGLIPTHAGKNATVSAVPT
ncbi:hypothetical protein ACTODO_00503 [Schaalia dentiphila ATCC 17982]|nr:hypothetical protein ACTODO_00503 [Schaalia odontolytica ATCC 17982]